MPETDLPSLAAALSPGMRLMGIDHGTKTLGLALSDPSRLVATPLETLARRGLKRDLAALDERVRAHEVGGFVIGLPVSMDGREGPRCQSVRQFARDLIAAIDWPLVFWDERWSTMAVERMLIEEADLSRRRRAQVIDRAAAAYILQGALDALGHAARRARPPTPASDTPEGPAGT
jgi:putative Holliday junction resolvase